MSEPRAEAVETDEPDVMGTDLTVQEPMSDDGMDAVIAVAEKMDAYAKAMDTIINAIIKRAYPGDFVCHAQENDPEEKKKANIGAAAAERIATFLGIQERNWTMGVKEWSDDHKHFTYIYEADFGFKNRWVHAIGRAGTRDKFFGFAKGAWKPLEDVQEDHIRTAAFRGCRKEGVRLLLGLRSIPVKKLIQLGYSAAEINYAGFESRGKPLDAAAKVIDPKTGMAEKEIVVSEIHPKEGITGNKNWRKLDVRDTGGTMWLMWSAIGGKGKRETQLVHSLQTKTPVKVNFQIKQTDRGDQLEIIKVNGEIDDNGGSK